MQNYVRYESRDWICREWSCSIAMPEHFERAFDRLRLIQRNAVLIDPAIKIIHDANTVRVCQKKSSFITLDEARGNEAAKEIISGVSKLLEAEIIHGDLCAANIGFSESGALQVFDWEPFLEIKSKNFCFSQLRSSKYAIHPLDLKNNRISVRSDLFAVGNLLLQALHGRFDGLKLGKRFSKTIGSLSENTCQIKLTMHKLLKLAQAAK